MTRPVKAAVAGALLAAGAADLNTWRDYVWAADDLKTADKIVALAYAKHGGKGTTSVWVAPGRLEAMTGLGRTAAKSAVRRLVLAGWLVLSEPPRQHRVARYSLLVPARADGTPRELLDKPRVSESDTLEQGQGVGIRHRETSSVSESGVRVSEFGAQGVGFRPRIPNEPPPQPARVRARARETPAGRPAWCGNCSDEKKRQVENEEGRIMRCPDCHPFARTSAA